MNDISWRTLGTKPNSLIPWQDNPRKISEAQLGHLKRSLEKFNYAAPIVVNADMTIIAGHMRCKAMIALGRGEEHIDVRVASRQLTPDEARDLAIIDNAVGGDWDLNRLLELDLELLKSLGMDDKILNSLSKMSRTERAEITPDPPPRVKNKTRTDLQTRRAPSHVRQRS